ncbi:hypothetical protein B0I32_10738 [Nonomuraea fuscirosea]|uniref:Uncharacterized protein n=1 Tax=Nonomuraea fuscirosea TaxID=1291556 RepID=A0A2T0N0D2_9ACTN|nr:hypothetical protein [Nonomuraea fuscirosea]PRX65278.1 hypothetical protein B0I32_10738 [Nonomuraea fuscirosea]
MFRPQRIARHAKDRFSSWTARHTSTSGLPALSAFRLRSSWIVESPSEMAPRLAFIDFQT